MRPKKAKDIVSEVASELNISSDLVKDVTSFYWSNVGKNLSSLTYPVIHISSLGDFYFKNWKIEEEIKKYQDMIGNILATFVDVVDEDKTYGFYHNSEHYYNTDYYTQNKHYFDELEKLAIEKDEQESRKDKLVVGSKWECVANCYCESYGDALKIEKGTVVQLQSNHGHTLAISRGIMPTQQFLLCFRPLKEGE